MDKYYLEVGSYKDLKDKKERLIYRSFEILPGFLIWSTFAIAVFLSWHKPLWVAVFIIAFDLYWLFKIVYLSIHTRFAYARMKKHMKTDWTKELENTPPKDLGQSVTLMHENLWQLVIVPMYKESYEIIKEAVDSIAKAHWPKERMILVLATEESAGEAGQIIANNIIREYEDIFPVFFVTKHPKEVLGELPGKGSNERYAGIWIKENFIDKNNIPYENIIVSSLDSDTVVYPHYFTCLAYHYMTAENPLRTSFQPIPLFINNIWQAPALSRVISFSSTFFHTMNQERPEKLLTFSSHSMPFKALADVGFWQPNVVSEDSRIFWQCFLYYDGDYRAIPLYYPVSMDANAANSFVRTLGNIYKQQRRWAYGAADVAYFLFGFLKNKKIPKAAKFHFGYFVTEGFYSWATNAILIFALGWLPLALGSEEFNTSLLSYNLPRITRILLTIAMLGIMSSVFLSLILLPPRPPKYGRGKYLIMVFQWVMVPISLIFFGAFPSIEAQTRLMLGKYLGFWATEKFRK